MQGFTVANARILTLAPAGAAAGPRRGRWLSELGVIGRGWVTVEGERIARIGVGDAPPHLGNMIDARGRALLPGFVDCHTHACWAGDRFDEADLRRAGIPYLEILKRGGGIMSTVRATRAATREILAAATLARFRAAARLGTTCIEAKSGYGLSTDAELRLLDAIADAARGTRQTVVSTFLGAHAKDPDNPKFVEETINVTLPNAARVRPGITCDAYCEEGAWSLDECRRYFVAAVALGCPIRVHADQFHSLGMVGLAIELGTRSVDHLEATTEGDVQRLAASRAIGVALPGCGFHLDGRYAPLRKLIDLGGAAAIATNLNPGSSPTPSMPFIIALAARHLGLSPAEAIACATVNAAHVLALEDELGTIEVGKRADFQLLASGDERTLAYEYAGPEPDEVWIGGQPLNELRRV
ncbi:MAG: imidazolonepropionase [Phycisphaerae bacterium]|nr:imidazolonepropionase [Phycisphaerae bacterium]